MTDEDINIQGQSYHPLTKGWQGSGLHQRNNFAASGGGLGAGGHTDTSEISQLKQPSLNNNYDNYSKSSIYSEDEDDDNDSVRDRSSKGAEGYPTICKTNEQTKQSADSFNK